MALPNIKILIAVVLVASVLIAGIAVLTGTDRTEAAIDMTGTWNVNLRDNFGFKLDSCTDIITQTGSTLSVTAYCSLSGSGSLTGLITKATGDFVGLSGTVGGDPVSFSGTTDGSSASGFWSSTFLLGTFTATKQSASLTFVVDDTGDAVDANISNGACATAGGACTLRAAIQEANALASVNTIIVPAGTHTLTLAGNSEDSAATGDLDITREVFIQGAGAATTIVAQSTNDRVFDVLDLLGAINVRMAGLTIADGAPPAGQGGAGLQNVANLILLDSTVKDNAAGDSGGGIKNSGTMTINNSTVSDNTTTGGAAGIFNSNGSLTVINSAVHGNVVIGTSGAGGGISHVGVSATLTLTNVTISGNASGLPSSSGGGLFTNGAGNVTLNNVTITDNAAPSGGGGIANFSTVLTLKNTIVAGNDGGGANDDCGDIVSPVTSLGHNLDSDGTCGLAATGDISSTDPLLGSVRDNGGTTLTHRIHGASPATDAGSPATVGSGGGACEVTDQRGVTRPIDGDLDTAAICDIGAFEAPGSPTAGGDRLLLSFDGSLIVTVPALSLVGVACPVEAVLDAPLGPVVTNGMGKEERTFTIDFLSGWAFCPGPLSLGSSITSGGMIVEQVDTTAGLDLPADMTVTLCLKIETLEVTGLGELQNCPDGFSVGQKKPITLNCKIFTFTSFTCTIDTTGPVGEPQFFNDLTTPVAVVTAGVIPLVEIPTPTKQPSPADTDGDGCTDQQENGPVAMLGGLRDYLNPHDFFDVSGDGHIDVLNDLLPVIVAFLQGPLDPGGPGLNYTAAKDRGALVGANSWNRAGPDGHIDILNDILPVILQWNHSCK